LVNYCWYISCFSDVFIKYFRELGLKTSSIVDNELEELFELSLRMFDTSLYEKISTSRTSNEYHSRFIKK
jgi:hypothetical protein